MPAETVNPTTMAATSPTSNRATSTRRCGNSVTPSSASKRTKRRQKRWTTSRRTRLRAGRGLKGAMMSEWTREKLDELIEGTLNDLGAEYGYHLEQRAIRQVALREFRDAILASQSERVQCELTREKLEDALQDAWNDWVSDTGCVPDFLDIHGPA